AGPPRERPAGRRGCRRCGSVPRARADPLAAGCRPAWGWPLAVPRRALLRPLALAPELLKLAEALLVQRRPVGRRIVDHQEGPGVRAAPLRPRLRELRRWPLRPLLRPKTGEPVLRGAGRCPGRAERGCRRARLGRGGRYRMRS